LKFFDGHANFLSSVFQVQVDHRDDITRISRLAEFGNRIARARGRRGGMWWLQRTKVKR